MIRMFGGEDLSGVKEGRAGRSALFAERAAKDHEHEPWLRQSIIKGTARQE
jgi:hypothetical protein